MRVHPILKGAKEHEANDHIGIEWLGNRSPRL